MKLSELKKECMYGTYITVVSGRTGRVLLQNAMKENEKMADLHIFHFSPKIRLSGDGTYAVPYLYCYADEDEYKRLKCGTPAEDGGEKG